jgi:hypothetical protein
MLRFWSLVTDVAAAPNPPTKISPASQLHAIKLSIELLRMLSTLGPNSLHRNIVLARSAYQPLALTVCR